MDNEGKKATPEEFIKAWQTSESTTEVAEKTGIDKRSVPARASFYRKCGIQLKKHFRGRPRLDIERLSKLADSLQPDDEK